MPLQCVRAQYYYKDIIGTREINNIIRLYEANKVKVVEASGFDGDGVQSSDFSETHQLLADRNLLKISSRNKTDITNEYYRFNLKGLLATISDTSPLFVSTTTFEYDDRNNPVSIKNVVNDANDSVYVNEIHQWFYNADGKPVRMVRVINENDTTVVRFTLDNKGNVIEELPFVKA